MFLDKDIFANSNLNLNSNLHQLENSPMLDKKTFYDSIRPSNLFHNNLSQQQVNGIELILDCWNSGPQGLFKGPVYDAHLSYMLATVYHETARTMSAVREGLDHDDQWRKDHCNTNSLNERYTLDKYSF